MKRIALAWEQGGNQGHLVRLRRLCDELERAGAAPVWALAPHRRGLAALAGDPRPHVQAPPVLTRPLGAVLSTADLLVSQGFLDDAYLLASIRAWHALWQRERIAGVVADYAPVAQLAAWAAGLPVLQVTNGFDSPPADLPIFATRFNGEYFVRKNAVTVAALSRSLERVGRIFGRALSLAVLFDAPDRLLDCVPQADPHGPRSPSAYVGPLGQLPCADEATWTGRPGMKRAFAYLRGQAAVAAFAAASSGRNWELFCVCPDWTGDTVALGEHVRLTRTPVDIASALRDCDAVLNYGSSTLVSQVILAGKPQLMMPPDIEKWTIAATVARHDLGRLVLPTGDLGGALDWLSSPGAIERAALLGEQLRAMSLGDRLTERIERWIR
ncbi:hypothetical protein PV762_07250 [Mitsuaria sp. CC2]|uniref:hypothetical protein n=1 Tax=Mitsuaria sp. CC2 TaxID=3029186 RepID=UPI003B8B88ED